MAKGYGKGSKGPGGLVVSFVIMLIVAGALFAFAKANNINSPEAFIDWTRSTSDKIKGCMQADVKFWTCTVEGGGTTPGEGGGTDGGGGSNPGTDPGSEPGSEPSESITNAMLAKLDSIRVGDPKKVDYNRSEWKRWIGDRCNDTRQQVLREQAVSYELDGDGCRVVSGEWLDPYTGATFTDPSKLDIDHIYALGAAAKNGGNEWDPARKQEFANDKTHLLAVSASANRSKHDNNPGSWWPENESYSCEFAIKYVDVAAKYDLQFSKADVGALEKGLKTCG